MRSITMSLAAGLLLSISTAQAAEKMRLGTEAGFAPFAFVDGSGKLVGLEIDLGNAICERIQVECEWQNVPWDGLFTSLDAGKFDAVMAGVTITEERKQRFTFSTPYFADAVSLVTAKGSGLAVTPEALTGKTVGTLSGTAVSSFIKTHWSDTDRREYPSWDEAWVDLTAGRIDAILGYKSQLVTTYLSKPENAVAYEIVGNLDDPNFTAPEFAVVFNKDNHPFLPKVDEALASLRADGTFDQVIKKYFSDEQK